MRPYLSTKTAKLLIWSLSSIGYITAISTLSGCSQLATPFQQITPGQQVVSDQTPKELVSITEKVTPRLLWKKRLSASQHSGRLEIYPQIVGDKILAAGHNSISAFNRKTGQLIWTEPLGETITGGLNMGDNLVFIGTEKGSAIALDTASGKTRWITLLKQPIVSISTVKDSTVVFRTLTGKIYALSTKDGELLWQRTQQTPSLSLQGASTPVLAGPFVITGFDNGSIGAYELSSGKEAWSTKLGLDSNHTELSGLIDIDAEMVAVGTALFAVSYQGYIAGIDMHKGKIGWKRNISSFSGIDATDKELFVSDNEGQVWKLESLTGEPVWKNDDLLRRTPTAPVIMGSNVVVGDSEGYLHWYDRQSGEIIGRVRASGSGFIVAPKAVGNTLYTFSKNGELSAYTIQ